MNGQKWQRLLHSFIPVCQPQKSTLGGAIGPGAEQGLTSVEDWLMLEAHLSLSEFMELLRLWGSVKPLDMMGSQLNFS